MADPHPRVAERQERRGAEAPAEVLGESLNAREFTAIQQPIHEIERDLFVAASGNSKTSQQNLSSPSTLFPFI